MKRYLLLGIAILMLVVSVDAIGWSLTFQQPEDFYSQMTCDDVSECYWNENTSGGNSYFYVNTGHYIILNTGSPMTYAAATDWEDRRHSINLYDSNKNLQYQFTTDIAGPYISRMEVKVIGSKAYIYRNGDLVGTSGDLAQNPSYVAFVAGAFDDAIWGDTESKYIFGMPDQGYWTGKQYFIMKDTLNPAASGFYRVNTTNPNGSPTLIYSNFFPSTFGKHNNNNETVVLTSPVGGSDLKYYTGTDYAGVIHWNLTGFFAMDPPYGLYQTTINPQLNSSGFAVSEWIPYISSGAHIAFDRNSYAVGETATLNVEISDAYYDTTTYDYHVIIMDMFGTEIDDQPITFSATSPYTGSVQYVWTDDNEEGVYYGLIYATQESNGEELLMDYDTADLTSNLIISGYVFDAVNATVISSATVNVTQGVTTDSLTTASDGNYSSTSAFTADAVTTIVASKSGYETYQHVFTPLVAGEIQINITLMPNNITHSGYAVGGIARSPPYNRSISTASIEIQNGSDYNLTTTNSVGYYFKDNLTDSKQYNVSGSKSGFSNSSIYSITTSNNWTRQDVMMDEIFELILNVKDSKTLNGIPNANIMTSRGDNTTTDVFGELTLTMNYTSLIVQAGAEGYYSRAITYIIDRDREETIYLTEISTPVTYQQPAQQVYPHYVTIHLKEGWGTALAGVNVTAQGVSTSTGNWDSIVTLLGLPLDEVPINSTIMHQTTDDLGRVTFYMIPTGKYNLTFTKAGYSINSMVLVPQDDNYIVWATGTEQSYYRSGVDELEAVQISIASVAVNDSYNYLNLTYLDTTGHTTGGYIDVMQKNDSPGGAAILLKRWYVPTGSPNSFTNSTGVEHIKQKSGFVNTTIIHSDFGTINRAYPFQLASVPVDFLGFGKNIQFLVAMGMMLFTAMLAGATHARQVLFVVAFEAVIFMTFGWFKFLVERGTPEASIWVAITLMIVVAIAANMEIRKKREKY